jgi:hypothetical protein
MSPRITNKFRLGFLQDDKLHIVGHDFVMNETKTIGQYISSNWFKEELLPGKTIYLFIIQYTDPRELEGLLRDTVSDYNFTSLCHCRDSYLIIGTFSISTDELIMDKDKSITHVAFENIFTDQKKTTMDVSVVKDDVGRIFMYGPCITIP